MRTIKFASTLLLLLSLVASSCEMDEDALTEHFKVKAEPKALDLVGQQSQIIYGIPQSLLTMTEEYLAANTDWTVSAVTLNTSYIVYDAKSTPQLVVPDTERIERWCGTFVPDVNSKQLIIIDWEGDAFKLLQSQDSAVYAPQLREYIKVVNLVRELRPHAKIAVYGLPFKYYYSNHADYNRPAGKFDPLFEEVDMITPSLYLFYPDDWRSGDPLWNENFLKTNLNDFIADGIRNNKPVVPFVWWKISTSSTVSEKGYFWHPDRFAYYMNVVLTHQVNGVKTGGLIMWDVQGDFVNHTTPGIDGWVDDPTTTEAYHSIVVQEVQAFEAMRNGIACSLISTLPCAKVQVSLPLYLYFEGNKANSIVDKNGVGTGFTMVGAPSGTRLAEDGTPTNPKVPGYEPSKFSISSSILQLVSSKGISFLSNNNQLNSLGVNVSTKGKLQIETKIFNPYNGVNSEQAGVWFGLNDKTFVKLVVVGNQVELRKEFNDASNPAPGTSNSDMRITSTISGLDKATVRLRLVVDPVAGTVEGFYSTDGTTYVNVGAAYAVKTLNIAGMGMTGGDAYTGIFATHRNSSNPVTYNFDNFYVSSL